MTAESIAELEREIAELRTPGEPRRRCSGFGHGPQVGRTAHHPPVRRVQRTWRTSQAHHLHRAPRHPQLPRRQDEDPAGPAGSRCDHPRRRPSRGPPPDPGRIPKRPAVKILVATDAAGEGVNLQRANLMVNYDLPWNPNRIEQRFGRIHRIGQEQVCHLWNLVAHGTREGKVFQRLFEKIEQQRGVYGDQIYDVLGDSEINRSLQDLLHRGDPLWRGSSGPGPGRRGHRRRDRQPARRSSSTSGPSRPMSSTPQASARSATGWRRRCPGSSNRASSRRSSRPPSMTSEGGSPHARPAGTRSPGCRPSCGPVTGKSQPAGHCRAPTSESRSTRNA